MRRFFILILILNVHFKSRVIFKTSYFMSLFWFKNFCNISIYQFFGKHVPEDSHMSGRNMQEVYGVCRILPYTYVYLLVLRSYLEVHVIHSLQRFNLMCFCLNPDCPLLLTYCCKCLYSIWVAIIGMHAGDMWVVSVSCCARVRYW